MSRRPTSYQHFPYTTLFRSCVEEFVVTVNDAKTGNILKDSEVSILDHDGNVIDTRFTDSFGIVRYDVDCERNFSLQITRSEEHTSELQSRPHLVCRLLLEKK